MDDPILLSLVAIGVALVLVIKLISIAVQLMKHKDSTDE
tara:strand:- start:26681 stop:26797 length:117 start_codon:yes stop_codon:yes gene_type:complete